MFSGAADVHVVIGSTGTLEVMIAAEAVDVVVTLLQTVGADVVVDAECEEGALVSRLVTQLRTVLKIMIFTTEKALEV